MNFKDIAIKKDGDKLRLQFPYESKHKVINAKVMMFIDGKSKGLLTHKVTSEQIYAQVPSNMFLSYKDYEHIYLKMQVRYEGRLAYEDPVFINDKSYKKNKIIEGSFFYLFENDEKGNIKLNIIPCNKIKIKTCEYIHVVEKLKQNHKIYFLTEEEKILNIMNYPLYVNLYYSNYNIEAARYLRQKVYIHYEKEKVNIEFSNERRFFKRQLEEKPLKRMENIYYSENGNSDNVNKLYITFAPFSLELTDVPYSYSTLQGALENDLNDGSFEINISDVNYTHGTYHMNTKVTFQELVLFIKKKIKEYKVKEESIYLFGISKGGTLALICGEVFRNANIISLVPQQKIGKNIFASINSAPFNDLYYLFENSIEVPYNTIYRDNYTYLAFSLLDSMSFRNFNIKWNDLKNTEILIDNHQRHNSGNLNFKLPLLRRRLSSEKKVFKNIKFKNNILVAEVDEIDSKSERMYLQLCSENYKVNLNFSKSESFKLNYNLSFLEKKEYTLMLLEQKGEEIIMFSLKEKIKVSENKREYISKENYNIQDLSFENSYFFLSLNKKNANLTDIQFNKETKIYVQVYTPFKVHTFTMNKIINTILGHVYIKVNQLKYIQEDEITKIILLEEIGNRTYFQKINVDTL